MIVVVSFYTHKTNLEFSKDTKINLRSIIVWNISTLENTKGAIKNAQFRETGNIGNTTQYMLDTTMDITDLY
jgi:hypothetical protein